MKIYKVSLIGQSPKYFKHGETADKYLENIIACNLAGGNLSYDYDVIEIDEREPIEVAPAFSTHTVQRIHQVELIMEGTQVIDSKSSTVTDLIAYDDQEVPGILFAVCEQWLAHRVKAIVHSTISVNHALGIAQELCANKHKDLFNKGLI